MNRTNAPLHKYEKRTQLMDDTHLIKGEVPFGKMKKNKVFQKVIQDELIPRNITLTLDKKRLKGNKQK